jgi:pyrroloquinoline quinone biosynthesis protein E
MDEAGSPGADAVYARPVGRPFWLLAELTYRCPLQCPYCSNPLSFARHHQELTSSEWMRVISESRALGTTQLGFSGGEPLIRNDLEHLVAHARGLGFYTNLITSAIGLDERRLAAIAEAGIDSVQISFQASSRELNDAIAGCTSFERKLQAARLVKARKLPLTLCIVIHRGNIDQIESILELCIALGADYVELASTQFYGWAKLNRDQLLPSREQVQRAEATAHRYQERLAGSMRIFYVVPDYHEERPKACMSGWGAVFLAIAPDGTALPCHAARELPGLAFPNVRALSLDAIWHDSPAFNRFRGESWMKEPCASCPERAKDFGGCRCQAWLLSGDAANADPVCSKSPHHQRVLEAVERAQQQAAGTGGAAPWTYRNPANSRTVI